MVLERMIKIGAAVPMPSKIQQNRLRRAYFNPIQTPIPVEARSPSETDRKNHFNTTVARLGALWRCWPAPPTAGGGLS